MKRTNKIKIIPCHLGDESIETLWTECFWGDAARQRAEATGKTPVEVWIEIGGREHGGFAVA